ncbi:MAG: S-adenosylmethionine synthetase [Candidatus Methanoperedens nitroreducens]|uniref:S-adenosylmethionine synthase n=1 Tax=Candidatus Methanoperedens nitratireducens TaxID=1392998 RepID=A0A0P7ZAD9_9EURY|nr:methionine adenosyltransferase [Candidatus Methanoperedens sp. BLZ2]KAB2945600.1 MAG: methionine adenosyltransferase [Candidatus Methanoperedens sp.]KPQ41456.1 MAG: S-adenosylmethionine synthetase [Candidatus Methanoperedens sp. BLZ1]MBZ0176110.1 methionine adenosyltransferase [Candidatus Methanoperedens nitroreducens]CAG0962188.1 S-adenosylmethionine synthetase [Methanosarcinales archaeon]MCX9079367.1 methionine adenosyltransferase [Candidatus Methanoperedens sp.]
MARNIRVEKITQTPIEKQEIEIVERKGVGHPDSMADGFAESVSRALCNEYIKKCGTILHHNTDQVEVVAGRSCPEYQGGELISPIYVLLVGRATKEFKDIKIASDTTAIRAAKNYLKTTLPDIDSEHDIIIDCKLGTGSTDLQSVFNRRKAPMANDTSFGVGHAPFSEVENIVYNTERQMVLNFKKDLPAIGTDIKVMGMRKNEKITLTVACAMIGKYVDDQSHYFNIKEELRSKICDLAEEYTDREVEVFVNTGDDEKAGSVYLTVTGTSAEMGDDGSVGRGNRCNGLITPNRPMSMEATSGKNPINHVGKLYNLLSNQIAKDIAANVSGIEDIYIRILSQIGHPIDEPLIASAQIIPQDGANMKAIKSESEVIIDKWLNDITKITDMTTRGELETF